MAYIRDFDRYAFIDLTEIVDGKCFLWHCILLSFNTFIYMKNIIEVHIAAPKLDEEQTERLKDALGAIGIPKTKFFHNVTDIKPITPVTPGCGKKERGHDLEDPGTMSTVKVYSIEEAVRLVRTGMEKLRELGIKGTNFEIERVMIPGDDEAQSFSLEDHLPEFQEVPNAPKFENHLLWKGTYGHGILPSRGMASELPSIYEIIDNVKSSAGKDVNQLVNFAHVSRDEINLFNAPSVVISRVATIYQPSHAAAMETDAALRRGWIDLGNPRVVTEQVFAVGEFKE